MKATEGMLLLLVAATLLLSFSSTFGVDAIEDDEEDAGSSVPDDTEETDIDQQMIADWGYLFEKLRSLKMLKDSLLKSSSYTRNVEDTFGINELDDEPEEEDVLDETTSKFFQNPEKLQAWRRLVAAAKAVGLHPVPKYPTPETPIKWEKRSTDEESKKESEETEEIEEEIVEIEENPEPLSLAQREAQDLFEKAQFLLNSTRTDKAEAYKHLTAAATLGHAEARSMLAWAQLLGTRTGNANARSSLVQDIPAALQTFKELADKGLASAHAGLGFLYAAGLGGLNASQPKALIHYTIGALGGDTRAEMALGYRYWAGIGTTADCEKALDFYRRVANKVAEQVTLSGGPVIQRVRLLDEQENPEYNSGILDEDLIAYYQLLAQRGDIQAQVGLGQLHYQGGRGVPLDHQKALDYFQHAAEAGNPIAMAFLGKIYLEGSDIVQQDNETAYKYFMEAARLGSPVGQSGLGLMYLHGRGVEKDTAKALRYFGQAADQGWVDGQLHLGNMYISGTGVRRDYKLANKYFNLASQSGHVLAFYNLAQMHATGAGMMRSCPTAVELLKNVAERGKWSDQLMAAHADYREGRIDQAFVTYALLAEMGYEVAQSNAAFILDRGETSVLSVDKGLVRALSLWAFAAAQGYSAAQVKLGDAHYYGRGTKVDYKAAARQYKLASNQQHNAQAMFNLGYMHERGLGLTKDRHLAKRCYDLAAESSPDARIPVALALLKLSLLFGIDYINEFSLIDYVDKFDSTFVQNWDFYLIGVLTGLLGLVIYFRRPQPPPQRPGFNAPPVN